MKALIVVDAQVDFISGCLGSKEAVDAIPYIQDRLTKYTLGVDIIIFTRDTHFPHYMDTLEGQKLPVPHCMVNSEGWQIIPELSPYSEDPRTEVINKYTFGTFDWGGIEDVDSIELCGVCTDICLISNALILRAMYPNTPIIVHANACAGVTPEKHEAALKVMESCQIDVIRD